MRAIRFLPAVLIAMGSVAIIGLVAGCVDSGKVAPAKPVLDVSRDDLPRMGLRYCWSDHLKLPTNDRVQKVSLLGEHLVVTTERNFCFAVDSLTGDYRILTEIAPQEAGKFQPPYFDGLHYFYAGTSRLIGINAATGEPDVQIRLEMPSNVRAISDREFVYTGSLDGKIFAYAIDSQQKHWEGKVGPAVISLQFCRGNVVAARSDVLKGRGELFMIRAKRWNEEPEWTQFTDGPITAPIVTTQQPDEAIFVASEDGSLYRFNSLHGWSEWRVRTPGRLTEAPLVLKDVIFQVVPGTGTWAIERKSGDVRWKDPQILNYLGQSADSTRMYFFDGKQIVAKRPDSGKTLGTMPLQGEKIIVTANPEGTRLYLIDAAGNMLCLDESRLPYQAVE